MRVLIQLLARPRANVGVIVQGNIDGNGIYLFFTDSSRSIVKIGRSNLIRRRLKEHVVCVDSELFIGFINFVDEVNAERTIHNEVDKLKISPKTNLEHFFISDLSDKDKIIRAIKLAGFCEKEQTLPWYNWYTKIFLPQLALLDDVFGSKI